MPPTKQTSFGNLLKKYRLRAEFTTLKDLGDALAARGYYFEDSTLSKWQSDDRKPERPILLILISLFLQKNSLRTIEEANRFLESADQGYLTETETKDLPFDQPVITQTPKPSEAPRLPGFFVGRKNQLKLVADLVRSPHPPMLVLHGPGGVGKTTLAIKIANLFQDNFPDGISWSRLDVTPPAQVLAKIAFSFGTNLESIKNLNSRSEMVRSLIATKKAIIIFDNVESSAQLRPLLPGATSSLVIVTTRFKNLESLADAKIIALEPLTEAETLEFFRQRLNAQWVDKNKTAVNKIGRLVGNLPLALNILANKIVQSGEGMLNGLIAELKSEKEMLQQLSYEDLDVRSSFELSYAALEPELQKLFSSLAVFEGEDFTVSAAAALYENNLSQAGEHLEKLIQRSLLDYSQNKRYRLHPLLKLLAKEKLTQTAPHQMITGFFIQQLDREKDNPEKRKQIFNEDIDNILPLYHWCFNHKEYELLLSLWAGISQPLLAAGLWKELEQASVELIESCQTRETQIVKARCYIEYLCWIELWKGDLEKARDWSQKGLCLARDLQDIFLEASAESNLGFIAYNQRNHKVAESHFESALHLFEKIGNQTQVIKTLLFLTDLQSE